MVARVFISYSHKDQSIVEPIYKNLEQRKDLQMEIWHDSILYGGQQWWDEILNEIRRCTHFVFFISESYLDSDACKKEWDWALANKRHMIGILIEGKNRIVLPPQMRQRQYITPHRLQPDFIIDEIVESIEKLPPAPRLPALSTLEAPELPDSPVAKLSDKIQRKDVDSISIDKYIEELRVFMRDKKFRDDARELLLILRKKSNVTSSQIFTIDEILFYWDNQRPIKNLTNDTGVSLDEDTIDAIVSAVQNAVESREQFMLLGLKIADFLDMYSKIEIAEIAELLNLSSLSYTSISVAAEIVNNPDAIKTLAKQKGSRVFYIINNLFELLIKFAVNTITTT